MNHQAVSHLQHRLCIAPMMDYSDRHFRYFMRLLSPNALLYTEMITSKAIVHGDRNYLLNYSSQEHPIALQLGGSDAKELAACAKIALDYAYDEINLNVGCPSDRVQSGQFGACLMKQPLLVADCVSAMKNAVSIPITVKTRIGVDDLDSYEHLFYFVKTVAGAGCDIFIIHARKAWLKGLSPKENRDIPPLCYDVVYRLKQDFPQLRIIINGGIREKEAVLQHLQQVDGVMIGREACKNPYFIADLQQSLFSANGLMPSRKEILVAYLAYVREQLKMGVPLRHLIKPIIGLFQGEAGARSWRRYLSEDVRKITPDNAVEAILQVCQ